MTGNPANINPRSMTVDGELNICHESRPVAETMAGAACEESY
jgi:phosphatidylserine/phosphatidylglycerophosphate/cardiolipin synthase-like enzyme